MVSRFWFSFVSFVRFCGQILLSRNGERRTHLSNHARSLRSPGRIRGGYSAKRYHATAGDIGSALSIPLAWKPALGVAPSVSGGAVHEATLAVDRRADSSPAPSFLAFFGVDDLLSLRGASSPLVLDRARGRRRRNRSLDASSGFDSTLTSLSRNRRVRRGPNSFRTGGRYRRYKRELVRWGTDARVQEGVYQPNSSGRQCPRAASVPVASGYAREPLFVALRLERPENAEPLDLFSSSADGFRSDRLRRFRHL